MTLAASNASPAHKPRAVHSWQAFIAPKADVDTARRAACWFSKIDGARNITEEDVRSCMKAGLVFHTFITTIH